MSQLENQGKKRRALLAGFNNVPKLLEEARRAVDDVTQVARNQGGAKKTAAAPGGRKAGRPGPQKQKAAPREKSAKARGRQKRPSHAPATQEPAATAAAASASGISGSPQPGAEYSGVTVKHAIPGRIRLRLQQMLHNEALAEKLTPLLAAVPGIVSVEASIATGSLLINFRPGDLATPKTRSNLAGVLRRFFPRLDTESLIKRMLEG
jgi:heavy-metal-associated domain-containing protein